MLTISIIYEELADIKAKSGGMRPITRDSSMPGSGRPLHARLHVGVRVELAAFCDQMP